MGTWIEFNLKVGAVGALGKVRNIEMMVIGMMARM